MLLAVRKTTLTSVIWAKYPQNVLLRNGKKKICERFLIFLLFSELLREIFANGFSTGERCHFTKGWAVHSLHQPQVCVKALHRHNYPYRDAQPPHIHAPPCLGWSNLHGDTDGSWLPDEQRFKGRCSVLSLFQPLGLLISVWFHLGDVV